MFRSRLFRKLLFSAFLLIASTLILLDVYLERDAAQRQIAFTVQQLEGAARIFEGEVRGLARSEVRAWAREAGLRARARITMIDPAGVVLGDSEADPKTMDSHANRPEVREAFRGRVGKAVRYSATVGRDLCYVGLPLAFERSPGYVLRLAVPVDDIDKAVAAVRWRILTASLGAALLALGIAYLFSRSLTRRIGRLQSFAEDLSAQGFSGTLAVDGDDELGRLAGCLNRMAAGLERLERVRRDFVANVSHELRTPLTAIQGYSETLLDGALEDRENSRRFLEIIQTHSARLNNIASDLLALSELEGAGPGAEPGRVAVRAALEAAIRTVEAEARLRDVRLVSGPIEDLEILGYKLRLEQVLVNLLTNAVKFNHPGGEVRIEATRTPEGKARVTIADTGIGIPGEDLSRIFERFYRVDRARSREVGGTGLGLSIVKHAIERMHGTVSVESDLGKGSTFTVTLPLAGTPSLSAGAARRGAGTQL